METIPRLRLIPKSSEPPSALRSATSLPTSSSHLENRVHTLTDRLQVLVLTKPGMGIFLLGVVERFAKRALDEH